MRRPRRPEREQRLLRRSPIPWTAATPSTASIPACTTCSVPLSSDPGCGAGNLLSEWWNDQPDLESSDPITVVDDADTGGIDADLDIAGTISGRLESPGGDPLANACVTAYNAAYDVVGGDLTEADGSYAIELLPAGTYRLQFIPCNAGNYLGEYYDDADTLAEATGIPPAEGEDIDLGDADLEVGGRIAGLVENDEGDPLADVCVIAYDTAPGASDESSMSAMTGVDGTFAVPGLETGSYKLLVRDCDNHHNVLEQYWDGARTRGAADPVAVTAGSITQLPHDIALVSGGTLAGTVRDENSDPLGGICVQAEERRGVVRSAETGIDGTYTLTGLNGDYVLGFFDCDDHGVLDEYYDDAADERDAEGIEVDAGEDLTGFDAELAPGAVISGTVTATIGGLPLDDICVDAEGPDFGNDATDETGEYSITGLEAGSYTLHFEACGSGGGSYAPEYFHDKLTRVTATRVVVAAAGTATANEDLGPADRSAAG